METMETEVFFVGNLWINVSLCLSVHDRIQKQNQADLLLLLVGSAVEVVVVDAVAVVMVVAGRAVSRLLGPGTEGFTCDDSWKDKIDNSDLQTEQNHSEHHTFWVYRSFVCIDNRECSFKISYVQKITTDENLSVLMKRFDSFVMFVFGFN